MVADGEFSIDQMGAGCSGGEGLGVSRAVHAQPTLRFKTRSVRSRLEDVIEVEIGPRLLLLHSREAPHASTRKPTRADIEQLGELVVGKHEENAIKHFERVRAQGYGFSALLVDFIAPAAHYLGELWKQDLCDFFDVTVGIGRLQALMDRVDPSQTAPVSDLRRQAILIAPSGETHLFGIRMVRKFLEATGWSVTYEPGRPAEDNARTVATQWFGVIGVTVSAEARLEIAAKTIAGLRLASMNREVKIMVGGPPFNQDPALAARVGADAAAFDAPSAALLATHLLTLQRQG